MRTLTGVLIGAVIVGCGAPHSAGLSDIASEPAAESLRVPRAGDILLVPLNCYVCNAIESETGSIYSHSVVVANSVDNPAQRFVYEAWGTTRKSPYSEILSRRQKNHKLLLLRPKQFMNSVALTEEKLRTTFDSEFLGLPFDDEFLWSNNDTQGREKLYCSEFVVKFINRVLKDKVIPQPMNFSKNLPFWNKYYQQFGMTPPHGQDGASPSTLLNSPLLQNLGELGAD